ncbi:ATP-binding protein [Methylobacterium komagatae]|uniref:ATP-binding protein n=1 Tax=Methylobacterium komagatae TaxID=374425 RepID=A0ABW2BKI7_9HYPH
MLLCRDLVERQGAVLTVTSAIDRGTTFWFRLAASILAGQLPNSAASAF